MILQSDILYVMPETITNHNNLTLKALDQDFALGQKIAMTLYDTSTQIPKLATLTEAALTLHTTKEVLDTLLNDVHKRYMTNIREAIERNDTTNASLTSTSRIYTFLRVYHPDKLYLPAKKIQEAELAQKSREYGQLPTRKKTTIARPVSKKQESQPTKNQHKETEKLLAVKDALNILLESYSDMFGAHLTTDNILLRAHKTSAIFLGKKVTNATLIKTIYKIIMRKAYDNNPMSYLEIAETLINDGQPFTGSILPPAPSIVKQFMVRSIACAKQLDKHFISRNSQNESFSLSHEEKAIVAAILNNKSGDSITFENLSEILRKPHQSRYHVLGNRITRGQLLFAILQVINQGISEKKWHDFPRYIDIPESRQVLMTKGYVNRGRLRTFLLESITQVLRSRLEL